ncbi:7719_t:CDS:1, partial [Scutellospora calospora]
ARNNKEPFDYDWLNFLPLRISFIKNRFDVTDHFYIVVNELWPQVCTYIMSLPTSHQRYKDLLIFEERLKQNLHQLQRRSYKYE